jgi:hypothetical protein
MQTEMKVAQEVAEAEFVRFLDAMDIDADMKALDEDDRGAFEKHKRNVVHAIIRGDLVVNDKGEPVYTPRVAIKDIDSLTFHEPTGATLRAADGKKQGDDNARVHAIMGAMTRKPPVVFANMSVRDLKVCSSIVTLFLG